MNSVLLFEVESILIFFNTEEVVGGGWVVVIKNALPTNE